MARLRHEVFSERSEKETYKAKVSLLERQIQELKFDEHEQQQTGHMRSAPATPLISAASLCKLEEENEALIGLNNLLKTEMTKLRKQIELLESKKVSF